MIDADIAPPQFVGGGVLGNGSLQEEIRFVAAPELLLSRLLLCGNAIADDEVVFFLSFAKTTKSKMGYISCLLSAV